MPTLPVASLKSVRLLFSSQLGQWLCCSPHSSYLNPEVSFGTTASLHLHPRNPQVCAIDVPGTYLLLFTSATTVAHGSLFYCLYYFTNNCSCSQRSSHSFLCLIPPSTSHTAAWVIFYLIFKLEWKMYSSLRKIQKCKLLPLWCLHFSWRDLRVNNKAVTGSVYVNKRWYRVVCKYRCQRT